MFLGNSRIGGLVHGIVEGGGVVCGGFEQRALSEGFVAVAKGSERTVLRSSVVVSI
jgi:hypothetical protein